MHFNSGDHSGERLREDGRVDTNRERPVVWPQGSEVIAAVPGSVRRFCDQQNCNFDNASALTVLPS